MGKKTTTGLCARYVKEFANDYLRNKKHPQEKKERVAKAVRLCERGMITSSEAVRLIVEVSFENQ